jgi:hypothetical protein
MGKLNSSVKKDPEDPILEQSILGSISQIGL